MRTLFLLPCLAALTGCGTATTFVHSDTTLGRVVVYRNGIAYFERTARVDRDALELKVPADKVDDFLKSLTVVDAHTGEPAPIAYPTQAPAADNGLIDMKISLQGAGPHDLRVSYVTESPSWKPSYRIVLGKSGKVSLQAWAIVDNTSGEDWQNVQLGVGSSSALSFRFDLQSVRLVQRETLHSDDLFAQAPPMGGAAYTQLMNQQPGQQQRRVMAELSDATIAANTEYDRRGPGAVKDLESNKKQPSTAPRPKPAYGGLGSAGGGRASTLSGASVPGSYPKAEKPEEAQAMRQTAQLENMARQLKNTNAPIVVEGWADHADGDKYAASLERANRTREQLVRNGVDPARIVAVGNGEQAGHAGGVRIVEAPPPAPAPNGVDQKGEGKTGEGAPQGTEPIGTSHFESKSRMSVPRGTSAMVSILKEETEGEVVYFYDAESARGNGSFPFRAVRIKNPTDSALESGPVTVFGENKFVGEGLSEPIPARSMAFVPFALDRQILVERKESDVDAISRILTVQRGVFSTEVQHTKRSTLVLNNRLTEKATVYIRHTVADGYKLTKSPPGRDRLGSAYLFRVDLEPTSKMEVVIEEATPLFKSTDIRAPGGMDMVTAYLSSAAEGRLKSAVSDLLKLHKEMANTEQQIATTRDEMGEYRTRMDELHNQIVTLKLVKSAGPLMTSLEKKLQEVSDRLSKATIDLVAFQEKLMVARIKFQDGVADLSLEKSEEKKADEPRKDDQPKG
jgi:outer membrane protein OmpA-like peptidoglycan-associated protein/flagellar biosynthesis chaperone FliJ